MLCNCYTRLSSLGINSLAARSNKSQTRLQEATVDSYLHLLGLAPLSLFVLLLLVLQQKDHSDHGRKCRGETVNLFLQEITDAGISILNVHF